MGDEPHGLGPLVMVTSADLGEFAAAMAKAQGKLDHLVASKTADIPTKKGPGYRYAYADLADAIAASRRALAENEIAVIQAPTTGSGGIDLETRLIHSSGQWVASVLHMPVSGNAQAVGSAITYARRYALLAMVGLAPEDDDGSRADANPPPEQDRRHAPPRREEARCTGKAGAIAEAIRVRSAALAAHANEEPLEPYFAAMRELNIRHDGTPDKLFVSDGRRVSELLGQWCESEGLGG